MTEFLTAYGLWMVIALLIVIAVVYLLSSRKSKDAPTIIPHPVDRADAPPSSQPPSTQSSSAPTVPVVTATPVPPVVDPLPVATPALSQPIASEPIASEPIASQPIPVSPAVTTVAAASDAPDNLLQLKGVGPKLVTLLHDIGVTRFAQIAAWTDADLAAIDARLGTFRGRPVRDQWIDQARYLASGDIAGFEAKYGKL